ncbi:unnamed protein product, partial [marine sediment metagenome]
TGEEKMGARNFSGYVDEAFRGALFQEKLGELGYRYVMGDMSDEVMNGIKEYKDKVNLLAQHRVKGGRFSLREFAYETAKIAPQIIAGLREGAIKGGVLAGGFALTAAIGGQMGPQAALPEEVVTVPGAAAMGFGVGMMQGNLERIARQELGNFFIDLMDITDKDGNKVGIGWARAGAIGYAVVSTAIEAIQIGQIPGVSEAFGSIMRTGIGKAFRGVAKKGLLKNAIVKNVAKYGVNALSQAFEEVAQESAQ